MRRIVGPIVIFVLLGTLIFPSAGWDDAYITYWAAHALSAFGQIVNVNGAFVEQSSSLGLVVIVAALSKLTGVDASIVGRFTSIGLGAVAIWAAARLGRRLHESARQISPILLATNCYFVYWAFGGMEATLAAASGVLLLTLLIATLQDETAPSGLWVFLTCLLFVSSRPESWLILTATLGGLAAVLLIRRRWQGPQEAWEIEALRKLLPFAVVCALATATLTLLRFWYFGRVFPQPVYAKAHALSKQKIIDGLWYVFTSIQSDFLVVVVLSAAAAWLCVSPKPRQMLRSAAHTASAVFLIASLAFIVMSGGDGMHGGRFFVPAIPVALALSVAWLATRLSPSHLRMAVAAWVAAQMAGTAAFARTQSNSDPIWAVMSPEDAGGGNRFDWFERANHDHRRYIPVVLELERQVGALLPDHRPVSILSGQSGFALYHLGKTHHGNIRYLDRFALATRDFLECPVSRGLPRTEWGLLVTIGDFIRQGERYQRECGIAPPDIIFELLAAELPRGLERTLEAAGYSLPYLQTWNTAGTSTLFPGHAVEGIYIAIRDRAATGESGGTSR